MEPPEAQSVEPAAERLTDLEAAVAAAVDEDGLVALAQALVRIESWGGHETPAQELMAAALADAGLDVDRWEIDLAELARHPAYSAEIERERALGVVGTLVGSGGGRSLILNGHVDVVPPGDKALWTHEPFGGEVVDGRLYGRGALDMKGALAAAVHAARALRVAAAPLRGDVHVHSVVGEEDGGSGTLATILRGHRGDGAVVMEPTRLAVAPAQAGALNFRIIVPGLAAHGAVREEGVSALEKLFVVYRALEGLERERTERLGGDPLFGAYRLPYAISVGTVRGGDWASSVPDRVTVEGRLGVAPGEDPEAARAELSAALAGVAASDDWLALHPPRLEWWGGRFLPAAIPAAHPLVHAVRGAGSAVAGRTLDLEGMTFGADMALLVREAGIPTVLFGAGDIRRAHRPDEYVEVEELVCLSRSLAVAAMRFCG